MAEGHFWESYKSFRDKCIYTILRINMIVFNRLSPLRGDSGFFVHHENKKYSMKQWGWELPTVVERGEL